MIASTASPGVVGLPLAFVLASCAAQHANLCRARVEAGEAAREPVRAVVVKDRWWVLVQFESASVGEVMFPLDAWSLENRVVGLDAVDALGALRGVVVPDGALAACVVP
jgi:hypothetical protein